MYCEIYLASLYFHQISTSTILFKTAQQAKQPDIKTHKHHAYKTHGPSAGNPRVDLGGSTFGREERESIGISNGRHDLERGY